MKRLFILVAAISVVLLSASCSKSSPGPGSNPNDYYVRFKANGTQVEYRATAEAIFNKQSGADYITTLGATKDQFVADKNNMTIALTTVGFNATSQTYTNYATATAGLKKAKILQLAFFDDNKKFFMSWADDFVALLPAGAPANARVIFTEVTATSLKGNFSGTMLTQDYAGRLDVTDGEFYVKLR